MLKFVTQSYLDPFKIAWSLGVVGYESIPHQLIESDERYQDAKSSEGLANHGVLVAIHPQPKVHHQRARAG